MAGLSQQKKILLKQWLEKGVLLNDGLRKVEGLSRDGLRKVEGMEREREVERVSP